MYGAYSCRELVHAVGIYWLLRPYATLRGGCCHDHTHLGDNKPKHGALSGSAQAQEVSTVCLLLSLSFWALSRLSHQQLFCPLVRIPGEIGQGSSVRGEEGHHTFLDHG